MAAEVPGLNPELVPQTPENSSEGTNDGSNELERYGLETGSEAERAQLETAIAMGQDAGATFEFAGGLVTGRDSQGNEVTLPLNQARKVWGHNRNCLDVLRTAAQAEHAGTPRPGAETNDSQTTSPGAAETPITPANVEGADTTVSGTSEPGGSSETTPTTPEQPGGNNEAIAAWMRTIAPDQLQNMSSFDILQSFEQYYRNIPANERPAGLQAVWDSLGDARGSQEIARRLAQGSPELRQHLQTEGFQAAERRDEEAAAERRRTPQERTAQLIAEALAKNGEDSAEIKKRKQEINDFNDFLYANYPQLERSSEPDSGVDMDHVWQALSLANGDLQKRQEIIKRLPAWARESWASEDDLRLRTVSNEREFYQEMARQEQAGNQERLAYDQEHLSPEDFDPNDPDYHQEDWQSQLELYDYLDGARDGNEVLSRMADLRDQSIAERRQADTEEYGADYVAANPELYRNEFRDELNSNLEMAQIKSLGQLIDTIKPDPQNPNKWRQRERQLTRQYGRQRAQAMLRQEAGIVERPDNN
ncbi:hypothetical protein IJJ08_04175 [bacterium]|nr:hypothetical protein [bacterium]